MLGSGFRVCAQGSYNPILAMATAQVEPYLVDSGKLESLSHVYRYTWVVRSLCLQQRVCLANMGETQGSGSSESRSLYLAILH